MSLAPGPGFGCGVPVLTGGGGGLTGIVLGVVPPFGSPDGEPPVGPLVREPPEGAPPVGEVTGSSAGGIAPPLKSFASMNALPGDGIAPAGKRWAAADGGAARA